MITSVPITDLEVGDKVVRWSSSFKACGVQSDVEEFVHACKKLTWTVRVRMERPFGAVELLLEDGKNPGVRLTGNATFHVWRQQS